MSDRSRLSAPAQIPHHWQPKYSVDQQNSGRWSHRGSLSAVRAAENPRRMHYQPSGSAPPMGDPSPRPSAQQRPRQRKASRAGLLVVGTAAVAMAAGAATAVAVVDHSAPRAQVPAAAPVRNTFTGRGAGSGRAGQRRALRDPSNRYLPKCCPGVVKIQMDRGQAREEGSGGSSSVPMRAHPDQQPCGGRGRGDRD